MATRSIHRRDNLTFYDPRWSPTKPPVGQGIWWTCPQLAALDPRTAFSFFDDFFEFRLAGTDIGWIRTATGAGSSVISDAAGGVLLNTNAAADNDMIQLQWNSENFKLAANKPIWFEARVKVSDKTQSDLLVGLAITDTSLIVSAPSDGVYFLKNDGDANINCVTMLNTTATSTDSALDMVDDTFVRLGFFCDGVSAVYFYVDGVLVATHTTNIVDDEELTVSFAIQNGEGVAKNASIDYIKAVQIR